MDHGTIRSVRGLRLEVNARIGLSCVLVTHGAVFVVDQDNWVRLIREVDWVVRRRAGNVHKVLTWKVAVGRRDNVVVNVILAKLRNGASRVVVRLDAR